jgi:RNA polymerase sigma-70 factor (ECF subfamily)
MNELRGYDNDPDRQLVERAASGDVNAFEHLVRQYEHLIFRTIFRITKHREDAEDQTQETFLRTYLNLRYFRGNSKFKSWLTQIAINQALMCMRRRRNVAVPFIRFLLEDSEDSYVLDVADPGLNPEQNHARTELADHLAYEVSQLPTPLRSAFALRVIQGYTSVEAALELGISDAAVKSRVMRARKRLQQRLDMCG